MHWRQEKLKHKKCGYERFECVRRSIMLDADLAWRRQCEEIDYKALSTSLGFVSHFVGRRSGESPLRIAGVSVSCAHEQGHLEWLFFRVAGRIHRRPAIGGRCFARHLRLDRFSVHTRDTRTSWRSRDSRSRHHGRRTFWTHQTQWRDRSRWLCRLEIVLFQYLFSKTAKSLFRH